MRPSYPRRARNHFVTLPAAVYLYLASSPTIPISSSVIVSGSGTAVLSTVVAKIVVPVHPGTNVAALALGPPQFGSTSAAVMVVEKALRMPDAPAGSPPRPLVGLNVPVSVASSTVYLEKSHPPPAASPGTRQLRSPAESTTVNLLPSTVIGPPPPATSATRLVTVIVTGVVIGKPGKPLLVRLVISNDVLPGVITSWSNVRRPTPTEVANAVLEKPATTKNTTRTLPRCRTMSSSGRRA